MARPRRRMRFQPFRMGEKFRNTILVGLGVFLMAIFAVPFQGSCQRQRAGGRGAHDTFVVYDGTRIRYGQVMEVRRLGHLVFRLSLSDDEAARWLAECAEAERAGIRVSDGELVASIRNDIFPRRLKVEYAIAESAPLAKDAAVSDKELEDAYNRQKESRFRRGDKTYQPLSEVRAALTAELRDQKGNALARAALVELKKEIDALVGAPLERALKQLANERKLRFGETRVFTPRGARGELRPIGDAPGMPDRVFTQPIGQLSEPLPLAGGWCVFRVVSRSRGFGADGAFYPEEEGWVRQGFGVINIKSYEEVLREMGVSQAELETIVRQRLLLAVVPGLVEGALASLPQATLRERYRRDNTQAVAAYLALRASDFTQGISPTEDDLRGFFNRYRNVVGTPERPGYLPPERVSIEYVLGETDKVAKQLSETELRRHYERNSAFFGPSYKDARDKVAQNLAERTVQELIERMAEQAADQATRSADPGLAAIVARVATTYPDAFKVARTKPFAAAEAELEAEAPELKGAKLAETLFGERGQQYAEAGKEARPGTHYVSEVLSCPTGYFFFRLLKRFPSEELAYEALPSETRAQLMRDVLNDKAFAKAKEKAQEYRSKVYQVAFERLADQLGVKVLDEQKFLKADDPIPSVGKPVPELYAQLNRGEVGDLSDIVEAGDRLLLARLHAREEVKGLRIQLITIPKQPLKLAYEPSAYEQQTLYDSAPHSYLDKPTPIPFEKVKGEIEKLLARRQALKLATERTEKAQAELAGIAKPDLAAVAAKHGLQVTRDVAVDLAKPEAAGPIARAAGFRDAVSALKPGDLSRILVSADGRFIFALKARDEAAKRATLDVAAALYAPLAAEAKVDEKDARKYYDDHRDTAYVTGDEIKDAPPWEAAPASARDRVKQELQAAWAKKPLTDQLTALRDSLVQETFRTIPSTMPLLSTRTIHLGVETLGPFPLSRPEGRLAGEAAALEAIRALRPGEVTKPIATKEGALIALLAERSPGGLARAKVAVFRGAEFLKAAPQPDAAAIQAYYDAHKEDFRLPEQVTVEYLFADTAAHQRPLLGQLTDAECRRYFEERADREYLGLSYEDAEGRVRADLSRERAARAARSAAEAALANILKAPEPAKADFAQLARAPQLVVGTSEPFALQDPTEVPPLGRIRAIAGELRDAKPGFLVPRVVETSNGCAVLRLLSRRPARLPELAEARDRVAQAIKLATAREALQRAADAFRAAANSSFDDAAARTTPAPSVVETPLLDPRTFSVPGEGPVPALAAAVFALDKPGLTPVVAEAEPLRAFVALVTERQPDEMVTLDVATLHHWRLMVGRAQDVPADDLKRHYETNQEAFRIPEQVEAEYLVASYADLEKTLTASEDELRAEYDRSVKAGAPAYRDWAAAAQPAYLSFEAARDRVQRALLRRKAKEQADRLLADALKALSAPGAKGDLKDYASKHPGLIAVPRDFLDRERKGIEHIGPAPDLIKAVFAAKTGDLLGPIAGPDGACLVRVLGRKAPHVPPLDDIRAQVEADIQRRRMTDRAVAIAAKLQAKAVQALAQAAPAERRDAFRRTIEQEPVEAEVSRHITVVLSRPFYPLDAGWGKSSFITDLGVREPLVRAIFRTKPSHLTSVVEDPSREAFRSACYLAMPIKFLTPDEPSPSDLFETQLRLSQATRAMARDSWSLYLGRRMERH